MDLFVLGSTSGTEPQAGRHHTSLVLRYNGELYWFDAGESCAHTAHLAGLDLLASKAVFLSHPHLDHVGGLPHLLWTIAKLRRLQKMPPEFALPLYTTSPSQMEAVFTFLSETEFPCKMPVVQLEEGLIYSSAIQVEAKGNRHLVPETSGRARSCSFRITAQDKVIVYSADVKSIEELGDWIMDCDLLLMESGHHDPIEICQYLAEKKVRIGQLVFVHHGRIMLRDPQGVIDQCRKLVPFPVDAAFDGMCISL